MIASSIAAFDNGIRMHAKFQELDQRRKSLRVSWRKICHVALIHESTIWRLKGGGTPRSGTLAAISGALDALQEKKANG